MMSGFQKMVPNYYELNTQGNNVKLNLNNPVSQKIKGVMVKSIKDLFLGYYLI